MTNAQKNIILKLLQGHNITINSGQRYRVRDANHNPVQKLSPRTMRNIKHFLRQEKSGLLVIDKRKIRSLHGNSWVKQKYKELLNCDV